MKTEKIKLFSEDFTYPTKEERILSGKDYPRILNFGFPYINPLHSFMSDNINAKVATIKHNLHDWDICLSNRFGLLNETYVYGITYFTRGFSEEFLTSSGKNHVNRLLFEYHAEIFYYYFISARDIIAQIINLFFNIELKENFLLNAGFIDKIPNNEVRTSMRKFLQETDEASGMRNKFAHRFTPTQADFRMELTEENGRTILSLGGRKQISSDWIVNNIKGSLILLSDLMTALKKIIP
jgi:hypothetical protein